MKRTLPCLLGCLFSLASAHARNPEPLSPKEPAPLPQSHIVKRVVLVHGFLETGSAFGYLKRRLEKQGVQCLVPKLDPNDGRGGLEHVAEKLKRDIDKAYGPDQSICVIGFSMGGIVSRYYLQNLGGAARCEKFFTLSSPHNGTVAAWIYPTKGAAEMRPGSAFLAQLHDSQSTLGKMPVVSYRTPLDLIILPATSSVWDRAENLEYTVLMHPLMITDDAVVSDLERRLLQ